MPIVDLFIDVARLNKIITTGMPVGLFFKKYDDPINSMLTELKVIEE